MSTANERIIITGASDGIGKGLALEFAKQGHTLALIARREELLKDVKRECEQAGAKAVFIEAVDVAQEEAFEKTLESLDTKIGGASIFIANAGVTGRTSYKDDSWKQVKHTLSINVMGAIHGLEVMKIKMLKRKSGTLVGVSSIAGARGMPTGGAYSSSKAALTTHLESMRVDLHDHGISVVTIAPGFIYTAMTSHNKGKMPFVTTVEKAARIFANGILQRRRWIIAPFQYYIVYVIMQMLPRPLFDFVSRKIYKAVRG